MYVFVTPHTSNTDSCCVPEGQQWRSEHTRPRRDNSSLVLATDCDSNALLSMASSNQDNCDFSARNQKRNKHYNSCSKKATAKWQTAVHVLAHEEGKNRKTYSNHTYVTKTQAFQLFSAVETVPSRHGLDSAIFLGVD